MKQFPVQIVFEGEVGRNSLGNIGIDDISMVPGVCPTAPQVWPVSYSGTGMDCVPQRHSYEHCPTEPQVWTVFKSPTDIDCVFQRHKYRLCATAPQIWTVIHSAPGMDCVPQRNRYGLCSTRHRL